MKITDTLGRTLHVDVVVKSPGTDNWMQPLGFNIQDSGVAHLRVPHGPFAVRVMSKLGADIIVHLDGNRLIATTVEKGVQYIERDSAGNPLYFAAPGQIVKHVPQSDAELATQPAQGEASENVASDSAAVEHAPTIPDGYGILFVVARHSDDPSIVGAQPPKQEFEFTFQLRAPQEHDRALAGSLSKVVEPAALVDGSDLTALTPPESKRPTFVCTCTGCKSGTR
jgi:hypothetical protein